MISPIGNRLHRGQPLLRSRKKGLSFMEVMVTAVVLAVGLVAIYRAFFIGLDHLDHLACRLHALNLVESKIAVAEKDFRALKDFDIGVLAEDALINNRPVKFQYAVDLQPVGSLLSVFRLDIAISWQERGREMSVVRSAYFSGITALEPGGS